MAWMLQFIASPRMMILVNVCFIRTRVFSFISIHKFFKELYTIVVLNGVGRFIGLTYITGLGMGAQSVIGVSYKMGHVWPTLLLVLELVTNIIDSKWLILFVCLFIRYKNYIMMVGQAFSLQISFSWTFVLKHTWTSAHRILSVRDKFYGLISNYLSHKITIFSVFKLFKS